MKHKIQVYNDKKMSDILKTKVKIRENLLISENELVKDFLSENNKIVEFMEPEEFKEFYEKKGIFVGHIIENENEDHMLYIDMTGIYQMSFCPHFSYISKIPEVQNVNLMIETKVEKLYKKNREFYALDDGKEILLCDERKYIKDKKKDTHIDYSIYYGANIITEKIECIKKIYGEEYFVSIDVDKIKQIEMTILDNFMILLEDGNLYIDKKLYSQNVKEIFYYEDERVYIIYMDNTVEQFVYPWHANFLGSTKFDKIITGKKFFAGLKNKWFCIQWIDNEEHLFDLENIDDMSYNKSSSYFTLKVGEKEITFSLEKPSSWI